MRGAMFGADAHNEFWAISATPGPQEAAVAGGEARRGSRVRLRPRPGGDIFDLTLAGRIAIVEGIDHDLEGGVHLAVTLEDDPGRDLGDARQPGHRFFFAADEVELIEPAEDEPASRRRILVAGIGNIFLGDDGFGVEVARRLLARPVPPGVDVVDYGIRGLDLAYALQNGYDAVIMIDAAPRGLAPGTVSLIEPTLVAPATEGAGVLVEPHGMDPVRVLRLAQSLGAALPTVRLVACEPAVLEPEEGGDLPLGLSEPVLAAVASAIELVESLIEELRSEGVGARESVSEEGGGQHGKA